MTATIDIERLSVLLDRGDDVQTAAQQARADAQEAEAAARAHKGDDATALALHARAERRRVASDVLQRRASLHAAYCSELRTLAKQHGVDL